MGWRLSDGARLSWRRALAWRMARHHLMERARPADLARVASQICGLHAQVLSSAELSLRGPLATLGGSGLATVVLGAVACVLLLARRAWRNR